MKKAKLLNINLDLIDEGDRFRQEYDIDDLLESIPEKGILQPITVILQEFGEGNRYKLAAGGRRLRACKQLDIHYIPALIRPAGDDLDLREVEFLENTQRKDLTWQERMRQVVGLHDLMQTKHGGKWNQRATGKLLDKSVGGINRLLQLADMCKKMPKLLLCKTEDDAVRTVRKLLEGAIVKDMTKKHLERSAETLQEKIGRDGPEAWAHMDIDFDELEAHHKGVSTDELSTFDSDKFVRTARQASGHFRIGDAFEGLKELAEMGEAKPPIHLVEIDPPYGIDIKEQKKGDADFKLKQYEEIARNDYADFTVALTDAIWNATPQDTRIIYWFGIEYYELVTSTLVARGFNIDPIPCLWIKEAGQTNAPELYLARTYEPFIVATKGQGIPINKRGRQNTFHFPTVPAARKYHPTQRPLALMREILRTFGWPNSILMVPFLGSGVTLRAAYQQQMLPFGWEINEGNKDKFLAAVEGDIENYKVESMTDEELHDDIPF